MTTENKPGQAGRKRLWTVIIVVVVVVIIIASVSYVALRPSKTPTPNHALTQAQQTLSTTWANVPNLDPAVGEDEASLTAFTNIYDSFIARL